MNGHELDWARVVVISIFACVVTTMCSGCELRVRVQDCSIPDTEEPVRPARPLT